MDVIEQRYERWMKAPNVSKTMKASLLAMTQEEKVDAFFKNIEFGTAGMRGILGPGTNRLNEFTLKKANVAFARYLLNTFKNGQSMGVVISHDNRRMSREFTLQTAEILNRYGFKTYIFDDLRPTPELSFAVRYLKTCAGIMITASHNPKEHNGYKIYDENGCQLVPEKIAPLLEIISQLPDVLDVQVEDMSPKGNNIVLSSEVDQAYIREVLNIQINRDLPVKKYKIVFSPQHGASYRLAMEIFDTIHYHVIPVVLQCEPDPDFKGTLTPNPEDPRAYIESIKLAKEHQADLVLITDPDADRVGLGYLSSKGTYELMNGNASAAILLDYVLSQRKEKGLLSKNGAMYSTIVTSSFGKTIAESYGLTTKLFLTGFKFIGNQIQYDLEHNGPKFEFGYEESYGYLIESFVRDKDALQACVILAEAISYYKHQGLTLVDVLNQLYQNYGYHLEDQMSLTLTGEEGVNKIKAILNHFRESIIEDFAGIKVKSKEDYLKGIKYSESLSSVLNFPSSDVIKYAFEEGSWLAIRPSGTEPKCKFYFCILGKEHNQANEKYKAIKEALQSHIA